MTDSSTLSGSPRPAPAVARRGYNTPGVRPGADQLSRYFADLERRPLLSRRAELEAAEEVCASEVAFWFAMLSYRPAFSNLARVMDAALAQRQLVQAPSALEVLRGLSAHPQHADGGRAWEEAARKLAVELRRLDVQRDCMRAAWPALEGWALGTQGPGTAGQTSAPFLGRARLAWRRQARAKQHFVAANLRLVVMVARRYRHGGLALEDLIQEGNFGLMKAVERFDPRRGFRFSTYAVWWIRHGIRRAIANKGTVVRVPVHRLEECRQLGRASGRQLALSGTAPTAEQLARETGFTAQKVEELRDRPGLAAWSLDRPMVDAEARSFLDCLADDAALPDAAVWLRQAKLEIQRLLPLLKPIEISVLRGRFGLDGGDELTLKSLGNQFNLSRERIRQIEQGALGRLRRSIRV